MIDYKQTAARLLQRPIAIDARYRVALQSGPDFAAGLLAHLFSRSASVLDDSGILTIPVYGPLTDRIEGTTNYLELGAELTAAAENEDVRGIALDIDSPGGDVNGLFDLTEQLREARRRKPIVAIANHHATSAAYAIAASCSRIAVSQTGRVGSVGVLAVHVETSEMDKKLGVKFTPVFAGQRKNDYSPDEPLSDPARASLQAEVNRLWELLIADVAQGRRISSGRVRASEAQTFFGQRAVEAGFADAVGTLGSATESLRKSLESGRSIGRLAATAPPDWKLLADSLRARGRLRGSGLR